MDKKNPTKTAHTCTRTYWRNGGLIIISSGYDNVTIGAIVPRCGEVVKSSSPLQSFYKGLCLDLTEGKTRPWCDDSEPFGNATLSNNHQLWGSILPLNRGRFPMCCKDFSCRRGSWYNR